MAKSNYSAGTGLGIELAPGVRVGGAHYLLKRLLGRGETSEVWLARDVKAAKDVALKFLPQGLLTDENLIEHFKDEAGRISLLEHVHIVSTFDFVNDHQTAALVMEYVDGWSLATLKVDQPNRCYPVGGIELWIRQVCEALDCAHNDFDMVHGDLKPSNLLVTAREGIKVSDFSFAADIRNESSKRGLIKGIASGIGFLSPQQVMGNTPSKLDDIYSLGAMVFDLLTGTPPFYKGEIIAQVCSLKAPSMAERLRELGLADVSLPPVWEDTVAACLAKNPSDRPPSAGAVLHLLERLELPKSPAPVPVTQTVEPQKNLEPAGEAKLHGSQVAEPASELPSVSVAGPTPKPAIWAILIVVVMVFGLAGAVWFAKNSKPMAVNVSSVTPGPPATPETGLAAGVPGSLDPGFNVGSGAEGDVRCLAIQADGKILVGGTFSRFDGVSMKSIVRLNADGSLDRGFAPRPAGRVHAVAIQRDGKIVVGGEAMQSGHPRRRVMRLNPDGSLDEKFGFHVNYSSEIRSLVVQPDGKILVGGSFNMILDKKQGGIVRLNADGTLDETFKPGLGASAIVWSMAVQPDGKILAVGAFTSFNGVEAGRMVRLNVDGTVDSQFNIGTGADNEVLTVAVQNDGKIVIGGKFLAVNGHARTHIARLDADGFVDAAFNSDGVDGQVRDVALQPDGRLVLGGGFGHVNGKNRSHVARLNADGSLDDGFDAGAGATSLVWKVLLQADGKILTGGSFDHFAGQPSGRIARLEGGSGRPLK